MKKKKTSTIYKSTLRLNLFLRILRRPHNPLISQWATSYSPFQRMTRYNFFYLYLHMLIPSWFKQLLMPHVNIMSGVFKFYSFLVPFWSDTLYQHQHQYWHRAPSSGPNRHQHGRRFLSRTEPQPSYNRTYESSGTIEGDRSTGIRPCHAWIAGANFNTVVGEVWRTPSKNPFTVDRNLTLTDSNKTLS